MTKQPLTDTPDEEVIHATTEEALAEALNAGKAVHAPPELFALFGIADHGEDVGEVEELLPDLLPPS